MERPCFPLCFLMSLTFLEEVVRFGRNNSKWLRNAFSLILVSHQLALSEAMSFSGRQVMKSYYVYSGFKKTFIFCLCFLILISICFFMSVLNFVGHVSSWPSCLHGRIFFSWVYRGSENFSNGYFVGPRVSSQAFHGSNFFSRSYFVSPKFSLVGIICGFKIFFRGSFVVPKFSSWIFYRSKIFLVGILWVQILFLWVFRWFNFLFIVAYFVIRGSSVFGSIRKYINTSQTAFYS